MDFSQGWAPLNLVLAQFGNGSNCTLDVWIDKVVIENPAPYSPPGSFAAMLAPYDNPGREIDCADVNRDGKADLLGHDHIGQDSARRLSQHIERGAVHVEPDSRADSLGHRYRDGGLADAILERLGRVVALGAIRDLKELGSGLRVWGEDRLRPVSGRRRRRIDCLQRRSMLRAVSRPDRGPHEGVCRWLDAGPAVHATSRYGDFALSRPACPFECYSMATN